MYRQFKGVDHIDPLKSELICGLDVSSNIVESCLKYNKAKSNAFVPYRICSLPAPIKFGDAAEFLISGEWVVCKFGGNKWWREAKNLGYSRTNTRGTFWIHNPSTGKELMVTEEGGIPPGFVKGRNKEVLNAKALQKNSGAIRGKKAFFNKETGKLKYFDKNPNKTVWEKGLPLSLRKKLSVTGRVPKRPDLDLIVANIIYYYSLGMSTSHLAKLYATNHRTISLLLKKNGVELRRRAAIKAERDLSKRLYNDAISQIGSRNP
jgi:hypothetical protein